MYIEIEHPPGIKRHIFIERIQASPEAIMAGLKNFTVSDNEAFKKGYTLEVLGHARLSDRGCALRLDTPALVNEHIGAANLMHVFEAILAHSIMPEHIAAAEQEAARKLQ